MVSTWQSKINLEVSSIMLYCEKSYWEQAVNYRSISQTLSQCDLNPEGNTGTRKLARALLELNNVKTVKLWRDTIFITVSGGTSQPEATTVIEAAREILARMLT